jgi:hypothetical protein
MRLLCGAVQLAVSSRLLYHPIMTHSMSFLASCRLYCVVSSKHQFFPNFSDVTVALNPARHLRLQPGVPYVSVLYTLLGARR